MRWTEKTWLLVERFHHPVAPHKLAEYFPGINEDLTKVTWVHGVNTMEKLEKALDGEALMIEADVVLGWKSEEDQQNQKKPEAIMANPSTNVSDLTLRDFIYKFLSSGVVKGLKLDFKSSDAFLNSEWLIERLYYHSYKDFPLWLNADIVPGPVNATSKVVDPDYFLRSCFNSSAHFTLSVGWTTELEPGSLEGSYSKEDVDCMKEVLSNCKVKVPVTFAVRAALAARSVKTMVSLIETSIPGSTLTIWSNVETDIIDVEALRSLIDQVGRDRIYLDLPTKIINQLNSSKNLSNPSNSKNTSSFPSPDNISSSSSSENSSSSLSFERTSSSKRFKPSLSVTIVTIFIYILGYFYN